MTALCLSLCYLLCISKLRLLIYNVDVFVILSSPITFCFKFTVFYHLGYYYFYQSQGGTPASLVQIRRAFMKKKLKKNPRVSIKRFSLASRLHHGQCQRSNSSARGLTPSTAPGSGAAARLVPHEEQQPFPPGGKKSRMLTG